MGMEPAFAVFSSAVRGISVVGVAEPAFAVFSAELDELLLLLKLE